MDSNQESEHLQEHAIWEAMLSISNDAIFSKDLNNRITFWTSGAERMYGYSQQEMLGRHVSCLLPSDRVAEVDEIHDTIIQGRTIHSWETVRRAKDGRWLKVTLSASPIRDSLGVVTGAVIIARDVTEDHRVAAEARHSSFMLTTSNQVAIDILANSDGREALRHIAEAARVIAGAKYAALGVARADGHGLSDFVTVGLTPEQEAAIGPRPIGEGVLGLLLTRKEPLRIDVLSEHPSSAGFPAYHPAMTSFLGVPIRRGDRVIGSLYLTEKKGADSFTNVDEVAVEALGAYAAVAIHSLQMQTTQRALVRRLIQSQEEERRAVAYDLHDGLTQYVMSSHAHLEAFQNAQTNGDTERAHREADMGLSFLKEAIVESRRMINGLRALALDDLGLVGAVEQLLSEEKQRASWQHVEFTHNIGQNRFETVIETTAYRIIQEALTNVRKHASCDRIEVQAILSLADDDLTDSLTLIIKDWGCGFVPEQKRDDSERVGLTSMFERAVLVDGTFSVRSAPGEGTTIRVTLPAVQRHSKVTVRGEIRGNT